jgi:hypothetical protein
MALDPVTASLLISTITKGVGNLVEAKNKKRTATTSAQIEAQFLIPVRTIMERGDDLQINNTIGELNKVKGTNLSADAAKRVDQLLNDLEAAKQSYMKSNKGAAVGAAAQGLQGRPSSVTTNSTSEPVAPVGFFAKLKSLRWYWLVLIAVGVVALYKLIMYYMKPKGRRVRR